MTPDWLNSYLQTIDWNSLITAIIFGGLGFFVKTTIDYYRERSIKKTESDLDIRKLLFENKLSFMFKTQQMLLDTQGSIQQIYNQLDHINGFVLYSDQSSITYAVDTVEFHTIHILKQLKKLNSSEVEIVISDFEALTKLRNDFEECLSENGVWRDFQRILVELDLDYSLGYFSKDKVKKNPKGADALARIKNFSEILIEDFKEAIVDLRSHTRKYPTLKETGILFPFRKFDSSNLRLNNNSMAYIKILKQISTFIDDQQLTKIYFDIGRNKS